MSPHNVTATLERQNLPILQIALLASFLVVCAVGIVSSTAQSPPKEEREIEDKIPKHLPLKFKVKNLNSEKWARDLEVEVTNTSDKPIYFLAIGIIMPEVKSDTDHEIGFVLRYGRIELVDYTAPLEPTDVPIRPNESYTFKIPEQNLRGWERFAAKRNLPKGEPKKVRLVFSQLNYGDGTGYQGLDGAPINIHQEQSINNSCGKTVNGADGIATRADPSPLPNFFTLSSASFLPANFLPVKLSLAKNNLQIALNICMSRRANADPNPSSVPLAERDANALPSAEG